MPDFLRKRIGILGGGQLGKMLCQAGSQWGLNLHILDKDPGYPAGQVTPNFHIGDFQNEEDVYRFGKQMDVVTIEIEHVAVAALEKLASEGVAIYPSPTVLRIIKDKGAQKQFYLHHNIPTAPFRLMDNKAAILSAIGSGEISLPFVQKSRTEGYDGRGVFLVHQVQDLEKLMEGPSLIEEMVAMKREIAVVVARDIKGNITSFPPVEMAFHPEANLVEMLLCPADLSAKEAEEATLLAQKVAGAFDTVGLLAVELFQLENGHFLVNEVAPRPHNSGHHTIECCHTSQYEQHLRAVSGLPLGNTELQRPGVMINILGEPDFSGPVKYAGWEECLTMPGVFIHLYGKSETRPYRKMGHVTITAPTLSEAIQKADIIRNTLKAIA